MAVEAIVPAADVRRMRLATLACDACFLVIGLVATLIGPALPTLAARYGIPMAQAGIFPSLQSIGLFLGVVVSGWLLDRLGTRLILVVGTGFMCVGLLAFGSAQSLLIVYLAATCYGMGTGFLSVAPNVTIAALNPVNTGAAVSLLNVFYGAGAILGPQLSAFAFSQGDYTLAYRIAAGLSVALALLIAVAMPNFSQKTSPPTLSPLRREEAKKGSERAMNSRWLILTPFAISMFLYVGIETGFSAWISTQMQTVALSTAAIGALATSLFWIGLTTGRIVASLLLRRLRAARILIGVLLLIVGGAIVLLAAGQIQVIGLACAFVVGLGCGPCFPILFSSGSNLYPEARGWLSGLLIAIGTIGGAFGPWAEGQLGGGHSGGMVYEAVVGSLTLGVVILMVRARRIG